MKSNFLSKAKWYIAGFILIAIILSISLSFCSWDNLSLESKIVSSSGKYWEKQYDLTVDNNNNALADVGDIVEYGKYYQTSATVKSPIRWIVVENKNNQLTLLSENVLAFGSFWGTFYYTQKSLDENHTGLWGSKESGVYNQNYTDSTVRRWLNWYNNTSSLSNRTDGGTQFDTKSSKIIFRGFASEAFSAKEYNNIVNYCTLNYSMSVGDTVYFGQYYQTVKGDTLSQLEWRVVDINNDGNYVLMTEYVIANGCFYGDQYYYLDYTDRYNVPGAQSYNTSSARAWLNNSQRYDGGTNFNDNSGLRNVFNGFYNVAFSSAEKNIIIPRTISGMSGYGLIDIVTSEFPIMNYETLENEKIWLPSAWEMGFETIQDVVIADNKQDKQFSYFLNESKIAYSNPFTTSTFSNFTHINATHLANNTDITSSISEGDIVPKVYSLRSPSPLVKWESLTITANGSINDMITCRPNGGMRPCVIVQSLK